MEATLVKRCSRFAVLFRVCAAQCSVVNKGPKVSLVLMPYHMNASAGDFRLLNNGHALTASSAGGPVSCYIPWIETINIQARDATGCIWRKASSAFDADRQAF